MFLPFQIVSCQREFGETAQDSFEEDLCFQPDQRRANAKVNPYSKSQMSSLAAGDIEAVGVRKSFGVAVGRCDDRVDQVTFANPPAMYFRIFNCGTIGDLN